MKLEKWRSKRVTIFAFEVYTIFDHLKSEKEGSGLIVDANLILGVYRDNRNAIIINLGVSDVRNEKSREL